VTPSSASTAAATEAFTDPSPRTEPAVLTVVEPPPLILHRPDDPPTDGRAARSHRTIERIVQAMMELIEKEGVLRPTADHVASRAGVSRRALYLHFDSLDEVFARGLQRRTSDVLAAWPAPPLGSTTGARIDWFTNSWSELLDALTPLCASATQFETSSGGVDTALNQVRTWMQAAVESVFQPELARQAPEARALLATALHYVTSYTAWTDLRRQGTDRWRAQQALGDILDALLNR
jgi:AcrR family transcriptional regulator